MRAKAVDLSQGGGGCKDKHKHQLHCAKGPTEDHNVCLSNEPPPKISMAYVTANDAGEKYEEHTRGIDISTALLFKRLDLLTAKPPRFSQASSAKNGHCSNAKVARNAQKSFKSSHDEEEIAVIHDVQYREDVGFNGLLDADISKAKNSPLYTRRSYIPSPLSSPANARRMTRRLGDHICRHSSPILSRARKTFSSSSNGPTKSNHEEGAQKLQQPETQQPLKISPPHLKQQQQQQQPVQPQQPHQPQAKTNGLSSFLPLCSSVFSLGLTSRRSKNNNAKNFFLRTADGANKTDAHADVEMHRFGDTGRIANRYDDKRWDVWTSMGENVLEYEGVVFGDDDDDYYENEEDEEDSSSDDEFLEIPFNDRNIEGLRCGRR